MVEILEQHNGGFKPREPFLSEAKSRRIILIMLALAALYMLGFLVFALRLPAEDKSPGERTDAIIALTGETRRITEAVRELAKGNAGRLFISGVHRPAPIGRVVDRAIDELKKEKKLLGTREALRAKIQTGSAENTIENALESSRWVRENNISSVRLMTSYYHMPRSMMVFKKHMPEVRIIPHPIGPEGGGSAFQSAARLRLAFSEYSKYVATFVYNQLGIEDAFALRIQRNL
jgi:uncharacterized SAM-binding protein YcdF (DUF218 family)